MRMQLSQIQAGRFPRLSKYQAIRLLTFVFRSFSDIRDVQFAFKRLSGWPKLSDHGLADVSLLLVNMVDQRGSLTHQLPIGRYRWKRYLCGRHY